MEPLLTYQWPRRVRVATVVISLTGAVALVAAAVLLTDQGPTCGGVAMQAGDQCDFNGSVADYSDVAASPLPSVIFAAAVVVVAWLVMHVRKQRKPSGWEIRIFELHVDKRRKEVGALYDSSPDWQRKWPTHDALLAAFDKQVERRRKRRGFGAGKRKS